MIDKRNKGFTLIEIIVSTAIFTVVVTVAISALISLNKASREARNLRIIMDNANSAMDSMARTIRMGIRFDGGCAADCTCVGADENTVRNTSLIVAANPKTSGNNCLRFYGAVGTTTLRDTRYKYNSVSKSVERSVAGGSWIEMTAPEVEVSDMRFFVTGTELGDTGNVGNQPIITMVMTGVARSSTKAKDFTIQTSITPRTPNLSIVKP